MRMFRQGSGNVDFDPTHRSSAPRQLDHHLHDRSPWRTRPFQMSRVVLPLPWGEGGVRGKGLACRLRHSFQPLAPVSIQPKIATNQLEYPLWMMRMPPVPLWNNPHRGGWSAPEGEGWGEGERSKLQPEAHDDSRNCQTSRVLRQSRGFPDLIMIEGRFEGHREPWASETQCTAFTTARPALVGGTLSPTSLIFSAQLALAQVGRTRRTASCSPVILRLQVSKKKDQARCRQRHLFSAEGTAVERGVYAASTHNCQQARDCSKALLLATLKRRERRAPPNTYGQRPSR